MIDSIAARASGLVGSKPFGAALSGEDLIDSTLTPILLEQIGDVGILEQHADRADQRGLLGDDVIAGDRGDIAAGGRKPVDHDDQRLLLLAAASAHRRAARSRRWCRRGCRHARSRRAPPTIAPSRSSCLHALLVVADQAL